MQYIREKVLARKPVGGIWCNLASSIATEIAAKAGFDWILIDMEHAPGELTQLLPQLQAADGTKASPIIRIEWTDGPLIKRVLDLGAAGIMVPYVSTSEEAAEAVKWMLFPPQGTRGVASAVRAMEFGANAEKYLEEANDNILTVIQIENGSAVNQIDAIAKTDHVDVLFIGPMDLSFNLGVPKQFESKTFREAVAAVNNAAKNAGKAAGILLSSPDQIPRALEDGFTFIACGSTMGSAAAGVRNTSAAFKKAMS